MQDKSNLYGWLALIDTNGDTSEGLNGDIRQEPLRSGMR